MQGMGVGALLRDLSSKGWGGAQAPPWERVCASALTLRDLGRGVQPVCASAVLCRCRYSDRPALVPLSPQGTGSET